MQNTSMAQEHVRTELQ